MKPTGLNILLMELNYFIYVLYRSINLWLNGEVYLSVQPHISTPKADDGFLWNFILEWRL